MCEPRPGVYNQRMTNTTEAGTTFYYRAAGFTEDITDCEVCGKVDLKGTVRLVIVDQDGAEEGELHAGVVCAARRAGRKAGEIRAEAKAADAATRGAWMQHRQARNDVEYAEGSRILAALGLERSMATYDVWAKHPEFLATVAAWDAEHPEPTRPRGW